MAKAKNNKKKKAKPTKVQFENQYYPNGDPQIIYEVDAEGNGTAKFYQEGKVLLTERRIVKNKLETNRFKVYEKDEDGRELVSHCDLAHNQVRLLLTFCEDKLIEATIFDSHKCSVVPWAYFDEDGKVTFENFHYNLDQEPVAPVSEEEFADYLNTDEAESDKQELRRQLEAEGDDESKQVLNDEDAFYALLKHNFDLAHAAFSDAEMESLVVKQFIACCEEEAKRRAEGVKTTLRLFQNAIPALASVK